MKSLAAFDLATATGWAAGSSAGVSEFGHILLPRTGEDLGAFLKAAIDGFGRLVKRLMPDEIYYEQAIMPGRGKTSMQTLRKLYTLGPALEMVAAEAGVPCWEASQGDIRTHFLGRGNVPRTSAKVNIRLKLECRRRGWAAKDFDEANALALLDYALATNDPRHALRAVPLFAGV